VKIGRMGTVEPKEKMPITVRPISDAGCGEAGPLLSRRRPDGGVGAG
jgi:hypothetical protein